MDRRVKRISALVGIVAAIVATAVVVATRAPFDIEILSQPAYAPQPGRNAGWIGPVDHDYVDNRTPVAMADADYEVVDAFRRSRSISSLFADVQRLAATSARRPNLRILEYYEPTVWFATNDRALAPYGTEFRPGWLLRDASGNLVPYYGVGRSAANGDRPIGYLIDLANVDYRNWVVRVLTNWMHMAPFRGVIFDSAQPLIGTQRRALVGDGGTFASIFCGLRAGIGRGCAKLDQWNAGLQHLIEQTSVALHTLGDEVAYNGIAPSPLRGPSRNLGMLAQADIAVNESFCYAVDATTRADFTSPQQDLRIMQRIAAGSKRVIEITNYQADSKRKYGGYCLAEFLMGWQPGSSYFLYQKSYLDGIDRRYPEIAERDLNLGNPTSRDYSVRGSILSRSFQRGFVALNTGTAPAVVSSPHDAIEFSGGRARRVVKAGTPISLLPKGSVFLLDVSYIRIQI